MKYVVFAVVLVALLPVASFIEDRARHPYDNGTRPPSRNPRADERRRARHLARQLRREERRIARKHRNQTTKK